MAKKKTLKKIRFLPYLPYGYCSVAATTMTGKVNEHAREFYIGEECEIAVQNELARKRIREKALYLEKQKYAAASNLICGSPPEKRSFRRLTKAGLAVLVEATDEAMMDTEEDDNGVTNTAGSNKKTHLRSRAASAEEFRVMLNGYARAPSELGQAMFDEMVYSAVTSGMATPLTYATSLVKDTKIHTTKYSPNQLYNIWRLSNIQAMFQANGHLTYMDRRPYDTGFQIDGITDQASFDAYVAKYGLTVPAITYHALTRWYNKHPDFYRFTQTAPITSEAEIIKWLRTPAFYSARELPEVDDTRNNPGTSEDFGGKQTYKTIHVGLATGKNGNFACYHAKSGNFN